ncbi:MAG: hypothetical protein IPM54_17600 [Polyangiaceae bacterium]|nr:hypothetical protein [Polyangiaceae bacterium]
MTPRWKRMGLVVGSNRLPLGMTMSAEDNRQHAPPPRDWVDYAPPAEGMGCE